MTAETAAEIDASATMFYRPLPERPLTGRDVLAYTLRGNRRDLLAACLLALLAATIGLALPWFTAFVFGTIVPSGDRTGLGEIAAVLVVIAVTIGVFTFVRGVVTVRVQARVDNALQAALWDRLLALPPSFFRGFTAGDLATRVMSVNVMSAMFFAGVLGLLLGAAFSLVNLVYVRALSSELALLALALVALAAVVAVAVAWLQLRERRRIMTLQGRLSGVVLQFVSAVAKLRDTGAEERAFMRWSDDFVAMTRHTIKANRVTIAGNVFNAAFPLVASAAAFAVFAFVLGGSFQTAPFMAYTAAFAQLLAGVVTLGTRARHPDDRRAALRAHTAYPPGGPGGGRDQGGPGRAARPHRDGQRDLLVRPGGAADHPRALPRRAPGRVRRHRRPVRRRQVHPLPRAARLRHAGLGLGALRRQGPPHPRPDRAPAADQHRAPERSRVLGSIQLNIAGAAQLTQDELWEAARAAGLAEDIEAMPMGMFTYVAEGGVTLSGGQRQRLLIARALSSRPAILFFDEATSALDNRTQAVVMRSLEELNATRVVIAQRLSTVRAADRIYVIEQGCVVQSGSYDELIAKPGLFRRLAERQLV